MDPFFNREVVQAILLAQVLVVLATFLSRRVGLFKDDRCIIGLLLLPAVMSLAGYSVVYGYQSSVIQTPGLVGVLSSVLEFTLRFLELLMLWGIPLLVICRIELALWRLLVWRYRDLIYPLGRMVRLRKPLDYFSTQGVLRYRDWQ